MMTLSHCAFVVIGVHQLTFALVNRDVAFKQLGFILLSYDLLQRFLTTLNNCLD